jgi:IclR family acetate operon transcriptional repressor
MAADGSRDGVQSLDRAFLLLELMAEREGEVALGDLAAASGLPLSTVHRIVTTLSTRGYVRRLPSRRYALGPRLIHLGERSSRSLGSWASPHLSHLVDQIGETANLALLDGDRVVYVAQVPSRHSMRMFTEVGRRVYLHCTGVGKVLLAQLDREAARALLVQAGMPPQTERTITDLEALLAQLPGIATQGFALDDGEQELGVRCVAAPLPGGLSAAAISVSGPSGRFSGDKVTEAVQLLRGAAMALAADLKAGGSDAGSSRPD